MSGASSFHLCKKFQAQTQIAHKHYHMHARAGHVSNDDQQLCRRAQQRRQHSCETGERATAAIYGKCAVSTSACASVCLTASQWVASGQGSQSVCTWLCNRYSCIHPIELKTLIKLHAQVAHRLANNTLDTEEEAPHHNSADCNRIAQVSTRQRRKDACCV